MLLGRARFTADLDPKTRSGLLYAAFVRSPYAHARVGAVDSDAALKADGVAAVLTAASLGHPYLLAMLEREEFTPTRMPILAGSELLVGGPQEGSGSRRRKAAAPGWRCTGLPEAEHYIAVLQRIRTSAANPKFARFRGGHGCELRVQKRH